MRHSSTRVSLDYNLIDAQQARRILDRLVGYRLSPVLWGKVKRGLSAGRVQSVALRLVVDREREIGAFVPVEYWSIESTLAKKLLNGSKRIDFNAALHSLKGKKRIEISDGERASEIVTDLEGAEYSVVIRAEARDAPPPRCAVYNLDDAAGGIAQAALHSAAHYAGGAAVVRGNIDRL